VTGQTVNIKFTAGTVKADLPNQLHDPEPICPLLLSFARNQPDGPAIPASAQGVE
jgi:hypothetical protein